MTAAKKRSERAQTQPLRGSASTRLCGVCGGHYIPDDAGRRAHAVVLGHTPKERGGE